MHVCLCVSLLPRLLITSGVMWHDMDPIYDKLNNGSCVAISGGYSHRIEACHIHRNTCKTKLSLHKLLLHI